MATIDTLALKERFDLLGFAERRTELKRVASTGGGEWAGPCPFCGGKNRFRVQPNHQAGGIWFCRQCTGAKWQDSIALVMKSENLNFRQACELMMGAGDLPTTSEPRKPPEIPAYQAPADDWQAWALQALGALQANLWRDENRKALDYLRGRGLKDSTIEYFRLGFSPGVKFGQRWIPRGVVIPCIAGEVWYLKIVLLPGELVKCEKCRKEIPAREPCPSCGTINKYRGVKGNRTAAIFNAGDLVGAELALFVEGEIDAMTAWQEIGDVLPVVTLGASNNRIDLATWGVYLISLRYMLATYDPDPAGRAGFSYLAELSNRVRACPLPEGVKDVNDYHQAGGDLWQWLKPNLNRLGVLQVLGALIEEESEVVTFGESAQV